MVTYKGSMANYGNMFGGAPSLIEYFNQKATSPPGLMTAWGSGGRGRSGGGGAPNPFSSSQMEQAFNTDLAFKQAQTDLLMAQAEALMYPTKDIPVSTPEASPEASPEVPPTMQTPSAGGSVFSPPSSSTGQSFANPFVKNKEEESSEFTFSTTPPFSEAKTQNSGELLAQTKSPENRSGEVTSLGKSRVMADVQQEVPQQYRGGRSSVGSEGGTASERMLSPTKQTKEHFDVLDSMLKTFETMSPRPLSNVGGIPNSNYPAEIKDWEEQRKAYLTRVDKTGEYVGDVYPEVAQQRQMSRDSNRILVEEIIDSESTPEEKSKLLQNMSMQTNGQYGGHIRMGDKILTLAGDVVLSSTDKKNRLPRKEGTTEAPTSDEEKDTTSVAKEVLNPTNKLQTQREESKEDWAEVVDYLISSGKLEMNGAVEAMKSLEEGSITRFIYGLSEEEQIEIFKKFPEVTKMYGHLFPIVKKNKLGVPYIKGKSVVTTEKKKSKREQIAADMERAMVEGGYK
jgi:hypothetical protein